MPRSPILKVLSSMQKNGVASLLMGGQACVLYGAAQFSRDTDLAILAEPDNLARLQSALAELQASSIAVPSFDPKYLHMGLAVHFRCQHPDAYRMRIDVMSKMRGVGPFPELWTRRTTIVADDIEIDVLSLPDLVRAKKTQRDKDWIMVRRLLETNYFDHSEAPSPEQVDFWLRELRTPALLMQVARQHPSSSDQLIPERPLIALAKAGDASALEQALCDEEQQERDLDRQYWAPLKQELQRLRAARR